VLLSALALEFEIKEKTPALAKIGRTKSIENKNDFFTVICELIFCMLTLIGFVDEGSESCVL
jgi:hypothetical protein